MSALRLSKRVKHLDFFPYLIRHCQADLRPSVTTQRVMDLVDMPRFEEIRARYRIEGKTKTEAKYLDWRQWVPQNIRRARDAGLTPAPAKRKVLDLGCGAGWFLLVARAMGHDILGLDIDTSSMYRELTELFQVPRVIHRINSHEPLPTEIQGFDLISAHMTRFDRDANKRTWGPEEWTFFLGDLNGRLNPGGVMRFNLNRLADDSSMTRELRAWFKSRGAQVIFNRVYFPPK